MVWGVSSLSPDIREPDVTTKVAAEGPQSGATAVRKLEPLSDVRADLPNAHLELTRALIDRKLENLRYYDIEKMNNVVAICNWGVSGSNLLASFLDNHDHLVMLAYTRGAHVYTFFDQHKALSLWDKLFAYPTFVQENFGLPFFQTDWFPVSEPDYLAAIIALRETYGDRSRYYLESSRAFFQFAHVAYGVAFNWRPAMRQPTMVYPLHDDLTGRIGSRLVEDFPSARFIQTVRDPITVFDRTFQYVIDRAKVESRASSAARDDQVVFSSSTPLQVLRGLVNTDGLRPFMHLRTRVVRFEDLHRDTQKTLAQVAEWLNLPFQSSLLESTFNFGTPWILERGGKVWSGPRPEQARRQSKNMAFLDRALIYSLLHHNFKAWEYGSPKIFESLAFRAGASALLSLVPMKMEVIVGVAGLSQALPALRRGNIAFIMTRMLGIVYCRLALTAALLAECAKRFCVGRSFLQPL
jgi:Sulfotransferase family